MSFALSAVILTLLLLPGPLGIKAYFTGDVRKTAGITKPFAETFIPGLAFTIFIHQIAVFFITLSGRQVRFDILFEIIINKPDLKITNFDFSIYVRQFICYNLSVLVVTVLAAKIVKLLVNASLLDVRMATFKHTGFWSDVFTGRYLYWVNETKNIKLPDFVFVDVVVEERILFSGILADFNYSVSKEETLENIILRNVTKRIINNSDIDRSHFGSKSPFISDAFIIPMNKICNINVLYINVDPGPERKEPVKQPAQIPYSKSE